MKGSGPHLNRNFYDQDRPRALFSDLPIGYDQHPDYFHFFDDFTHFTDNEFWEEVADGTTTFALVADAANGVMRLGSQAATDDSGVLLQAVNTNFLVKSGKKLWFEAMVKVSDADQCDMFVGLADTAASNPEAVVAAGLARVGFELVDGSANILAVVDNDTAATKTDTGKDAADDTFVRLGFRCDGGGAIRYYVNRSLVHTESIPSAIAAVTLGPAFFGLSGNDTGTHTRDIDYVLAVQER